MALFSFESEPDDWLQPFVPRSLVLSPLSSDQDSESSNPSVQIADRALCLRFSLLFRSFVVVLPSVSRSQLQ
eukprot:m.414116 g.414116  ORF g.414116 m.414116 type:complete len:72 (-) comp56589_c0_seq3:1305-1520(-)